MRPESDAYDLAALAAIFAQLEPAQVLEWIKLRPNGKYARRLGFLYEWLTGREVPLGEVSIAGAYEPVLDEESYFTGRSQNVTRWHVRDNLPGTPAWCPTIHRLTQRGVPIGTLDIAAAFQDVRARVPPEIFERALSYAYLAETQASYAIEQDAPTPTQRHAFLRALQEAGEMPVSQRLTEERLTNLQEMVFKGLPTFVSHGPRGEDSFVGTSTGAGLRRVEYPCPPAAAIGPLLEGLRTSAASRLTAPEMPPSAFAGVVAFAFVFIHPLHDGNGRVHRFLIHEALVERGAVEHGTLIPVSATMLAQIQEYRSALRAYSEPIRKAASEFAGVPFVLEASEPFTFGHFERVAPLYRYPVLTEQVAYLEMTLRQSIDDKLLEESRFLMRFDAARSAVSQRLNLPEQRLDLLVQLIRQNSGRLSATKRSSHFPDLTDEAIATAEAAVQSAFKGHLVQARSLE